MLKQALHTLSRWSPPDLRRPSRRQAKCSPRRHLLHPNPPMLVENYRFCLKLVQVARSTRLLELNPSQAYPPGWKRPHAPRRRSQLRRHPLLQIKSPGRLRSSLSLALLSLPLRLRCLLFAPRRLLHPHLLPHLHLWTIQTLWTICCSKRFWRSRRRAR